ncbi:MAG: mercury resistance system periplasmic binding protein MerP [Gammaproteobacteria bacterium]|nr:mercury resistance system periplasmic binding protein MerP [Gammaproteobacteria bacterium]
MTRIFAAGFATLLLTIAPAFAGERTVTLAVENMTCASCPFIVKQTLAAVPGVVKVDVSFENRAAVVTFDDAQTDVTALTAATARNGYPSHPIEGLAGE